MAAREQDKRRKVGVCAGEGVVSMRQNESKEEKLGVCAGCTQRRDGIAAGEQENDESLGICLGGKAVGLVRENKRKEERVRVRAGDRQRKGWVKQENKRRRRGKGSHWAHTKKVLGLKSEKKKEKKKGWVLLAGGTERNRWGCSTRTREKIKGGGFSRWVRVCAGGKQRNGLASTVRRRKKSSGFHAGGTQ